MIIKSIYNHQFINCCFKGSEFTVRVSFLEIYNEELIDLLGAESVDNPRLKITRILRKRLLNFIRFLLISHISILSLFEKIFKNEFKSF